MLYAGLPIILIASFLLTAGMMIVSDFFLDIIIYCFWTIINAIKYFAVKIAWNNLVKLWHLLYNNIIHPIWKGIKYAFWGVIHGIKYAWNWVKKYLRIVWNWIKKQFGRGVDISEKVYKSGIKPAAESIYHIAKPFIIKGVNIIRAIWNFIKPLIEDYIKVLKFFYIDIIFDGIKYIAEKILSTLGIIHS